MKDYKDSGYVQYGIEWRKKLTPKDLMIIDMLMEFYRDTDMRVREAAHNE